ncbi:hypothetical protein ABWW58_11975 [Sporolactobacillus sp. STCC-11]|uniref:hypothetical protein n=1 Tax=Sporolactobacillus caesalpiniae TaxID=3230362 RepID=UPI0033972013
MATNQKVRLSKDLGAFAGLLFEIGSGRLILPENVDAVLAAENEKRLKGLKKRHRQVLDDQIEENTHSEMQYHLARLGRALGYHVWIAQNDHKREYNGKKLGEYSLPALPITDLSKSVFDTVSLIDVLWLNQNDQIVSGFEVEKSTPIYSGILRLYDLSLSVDQACRLFLVAPNKREKEIKAQLMRPSFAKEQSLKSVMSYLLFSDLQCDCDAMCKFGTDISILDPIARSV